jgi:cytoskeleton protein RodZ
MFAEEFAVQGAVVTGSTELSSNDRLPMGADLISLIESQLSQSLVYRQAIESLQQLLAGQTTDGQMLLKAVSLEAIRLTLQAVDGPSGPVVRSTDLAMTDRRSETIIPALEAVTVAEIDEATLDNDLFESIAAVTADAPTSSNPLSHLFDRYKAKRQQAVESVQVFTRTEILTQIGAQIQLEREQKGMTIAQLHARTFIPMYHLQAFEGGHVEQLPEDVYLRGFLRRIENALGLEVSSLIDKLPNDTIDKSILPSWAGHGRQGARRGIGGLDVNPTHLYVTYAAIMAGGVCWLSNQTAPTANLPDFSNYEPRAEMPSASEYQASRPKANSPNQKLANKAAQSKSIKVGSVKNIAPPETLR